MRKKKLDISAWGEWYSALFSYHCDSNPPSTHWPPVTVAFISRLASRVTAAGFNSGFLDLYPWFLLSLFSVLSITTPKKIIMLLFLLSLTYFCDLSLLTYPDLCNLLTWLMWLFHRYTCNSLNTRPTDLTYVTFPPADLQYLNSLYTKFDCENHLFVGLYNKWTISENKKRNKWNSSESLTYHK